MPAILSRAFTPALHRANFIVLRFASTTIQSKPAVKQLTVKETGHFKYERDRSRDPKASNPQKKGDRLTPYLLNRLGHAFEVWPIFFLVGCWAVIFVYTVYAAFGKIEIWLDHSNKTPPWHWSRIRDNYWKMHTLNFDPKGVTHKRLPIMEQIQDDMLEASKKRHSK